MPDNTGDSGDHLEMAMPRNLTHDPTPIFEASLPACFGYFEGSKSNLLGLMRGVRNPTLCPGSLF